MHTNFASLVFFKLTLVCQNKSKNRGLTQAPIRIERTPHDCRPHGLPP